MRIDARPGRLASTALILAMSLPGLVAGQSFVETSGRAGLPLTREERNVLLADDLLARARAARARGKDQEARAHLGRITSMAFPADREAQHLLAGAHFLAAEIDLGQRRLGDADREARRASMRCERSPCPILVQSYELLARIASAQGQPARAADWTRKAKEARRRLGR